MQYRVKTMLTAQAVLEQAKTFFGPEGKGLPLAAEYLWALRWRDDIGDVRMRITDEFPTVLEVEAQTWDDAVQQFITRLPPYRPWWTFWGCIRKSTPSRSMVSAHSHHEMPPQDTPKL